MLFSPILPLLHFVSKYVTMCKEKRKRGVAGIKIAIIIALAVLAVLILPFVFLTLVTLPISPNKEYERESPFYRSLLTGLSIILFKIIRVKFVIYGEEKIPKAGSFLLVGNHRSNFDPIASWTLLRKRSNISYISKKENFNIPWFGRMIRRCCFMEIDRENPRNAMKTLHKAALMLKENRASVGIYPEGSRSKDLKLLPFHNGVFRIAKEANAPIVVAAMRGTEKIKENFPFHSTAVYVDYVDVITPKEIAEAKNADIGERVRQGLLSVLGE